MSGQFEYHGITAGVVIGTGVNPQRIRTAGARTLASHAQMVVMRTHDDVFVSEMLILSRNDGYDVMGGYLLLLTIGEVVIESRLLFPLDNGLKLQAAKFVDDEFRGEGIAGSAWISAAKFLRCQEFHRLSHIVLLLGA